MDFSGRLPAKETSHFPINQSYYLVIINYTVWLGEAVVQEAWVRIGASVWEKDLPFQGIYSTVTENAT